MKELIATSLLVSLSPGIALAGSTALVFAPPSNVRNAPNGEIICSITRAVSIEVYQREGEWYYTDACGGGYIHRSQIRLQNADNSPEGTDRARVVGLQRGQLALRNSPNGRSLAGLDNGNVVQILEQRGNWAYVRVIDASDRRVNGRQGWVNSYYLALF